MKKNILIFGSVLGAFLCINVIIMMNLLYNNPTMETHDFLGYIALVIVHSLLFFGVRNYRNKQLDGFISFGKAFNTGLLITLLASTIYVVVGLLYYYLFLPDFIDKFIENVLHYTPADELAAKTEQMESFKEMYKNPFFAIIFTYAEVFPIGLVVSLISAFILKKKRKIIETEN